MSSPYCATWINGVRRLLVLNCGQSLETLAMSANNGITIGQAAQTRASHTYGYQGQDNICSILYIYVTVPRRACGDDSVDAFRFRPVDPKLKWAQRKSPRLSVIISMMIWANSWAKIALVHQVYKALANAYFAGQTINAITETICARQGHDTTAAAVGWAVQLIGSHPLIQKRLHEELDELFGKS